MTWWAWTSIRAASACSRTARATSRTSPPSACARWTAALPPRRATQDLAGADAIVVAVPTPLTRNREPDLAPLLGSARSLAGVLEKGQLVALESTTYPGTTREQLIPLLEESGLKAGPRLQRGLLARAGRSGPHRLHDAEHAEGRRRLHPRMPRAGRRLLRRGLRRGGAGHDAGVGRDDQAARERLPLGEHRAGERAGHRLRPDGDRHLGGGRRRLDQALRLHALRARARAWAATASRSTRSTWPGAPASSTRPPSSSSSPAR